MRITTKIFFLLIIISFFINGCNKVPFSSTNSDIKNNKINISGKVDSSLTSISSLKILTTYDSAKVKSGKFKIKIANQRPQLIMAMTKNSKLVGLTMSIKEQNKIKLLDVGIKSTALSLLFLTPELMTLNFDSTSIVIDRIIKIPMFKTLENYIKHKIFSEGLQNIGLDSEYQKIAKRIYEDLKYNTLRKQQRSVSGFDYFDVTLDQNGNAMLINSGFRYVSVFRMDFTKNNEERVSDVYTHLNSMKGKPPWSFSILSTGMYPFKAIDKNFPPEQEYVRSEYWFQGPGLIQPYPLPPQIPEDIDDPWLLTILDYIIIPANGILFGQIESRTAKDLWHYVKDISSVSKLNSSNKENIQGNLYNVIWDILKTLHPNNVIISRIAFNLNVLNLASFSFFLYSANSLGKYTLWNPRSYVNPNSIVMRYFDKNCNGPQNWYKRDYIPILWEKVKNLPWQKIVNDDYGDAFFRINFSLKDTSNIKILIKSDDGAEIYLNEMYFGWLGGVLCHQEGCINMEGIGCGINHQVGLLKNLSPYLRIGENVCAIHVSNGRANRMYLDFRIIK